MFDSKLLQRLPLLMILVLGFVLGCRPAGVPHGDDGKKLDADAGSPDSFGAVAEFEFTERRGATIRRADLLGKPWLVGFIFTRCSTICPALTLEMSRAQQALEDLDVKIVAISVDPEHDTAEVLSEYAEHFEGGRSEDWLFLRADEDVTYDLIRSSFKLAIARMEGVDVGMSVSHSSMLVAVDAQGLVRGYYNGTTAEGTRQAIERMRFLAGAAPHTSILPTFNASMNALSALLLVLGFLAIKAGEKERHARFMKLAFLSSAIFLASYLYYHFVVIPGQGGPVKFAGTGPAKTAYLVLLLTHVAGAATNLPMVLRTFWLAHKERWDSHKKWAKWTFPLWLYVSVTGVMVYFALYVM